VADAIGTARLRTDRPVSPAADAGTRSRVLDAYTVVLLDLNGTFMFGEDRFGPAHDYYATYASEGGGALAAAAVRAAVDACHAHLAARYADPAHHDDFPAVREVLDLLPGTAGLAADERARLERVVARHELGRVPAAYAAALRRLARTHRLGLVSNIWSRKPPWLAALARAGVADLFTTMVFSSDTRSIKPSARLFEAALAAFDAPRRSIVMVGDSLVADVAPARALGLASVWIDPARAPVPPGGPEPDHVAPDLLTLVPGDRS
jgi:putative hydrolase of the HAD superfamily/5'-nucleotidase